MRCFASFAAVLAGFALVAPAQQPLKPAKGRFLVAGKQVLDPNFSRTVVLLFDYSDKGAMGVIVNRRTQVKLAKLLPDVDGLAERSDVVYLGGPVETSGLRLLVRAETAPAEASAIVGDVFLTADPELIASASPARVRGYAGYAGWGAGQLDGEIERGDWHIFGGDAKVVFSQHPDSVWQTLVDRTKMQFARLLPDENFAMRHAFR